MDFIKMEELSNLDKITLSLIPPTSLENINTVLQGIIRTDQTKLY